VELLWYVVPSGGFLNGRSLHEKELSINNYQLSIINYQLTMKEKKGTVKKTTLHEA